MSNYVFLIDANKTPMNPIHPSHAKKLLETNKAAIFRRYPFTLIMKRVVENIVAYPLTLKLDPGSKLTGFALVNNRDEVIWGMELQHRGLAISDGLQTRSAVRRGRRSRHTRYRQPRFVNRTREKGWLAPSLRHRVLTTETWVKRLCKFAPISAIVQELVRFDLQQMENPEISGMEYQQGALQGYEIKEYLLNKWDRKCTYCGAENIPLQVEHICPKANGGTNRISNLCLACQKCNQNKGTQDIETFLAQKPDLLKKILSEAKRPLKDAAAVNSTRWSLFNVWKSLGLPVKTGSGGLTKFNRTRLLLPKAHWIDAACVGITGTLKILITKIFTAKSTGHGIRRMCRINKYGFPCTAPKQTFTHVSTGDFVRVQIVKERKNLQSGTYTGRVKTPTNKGCEVVINGFRVGFSTMKGVSRIHCSDGYNYA
ncbi:MAG: RRXRR domain-containing protein [Brasilonema octagenarum HA4186-MV1]|jgi:5-methylcytosine-specific restriction endonuclease McrA|uniref:HNH endonuclease n=2 Tax=Brasilonema TaxID=383614 RepID=A0A856MGF0_9CYAN|nr:MULTISPECIES: RNA-guided endonuclease IscB [Brasilonema]MBW4625115.1 RRXRR domain-containing protein [Brasilonema octagenarum HA4186-MV1]NMF63112.1 HNH endonuclease [Brasilonema octagenarum UFV-OR1]QDL10445.1 HNH endonuclease [Brasilonema sennae CENA114]QDL16791.1 HNH endonuclease [Brasilonema octagenarum UFV-E1]